MICEIEVAIEEGEEDEMPATVFVDVDFDGCIMTALVDADGKELDLSLVDDQKHRILAEACKEYSRAPDYDPYERE